MLNFIPTFIFDAKYLGNLMRWGMSKVCHQIRQSEFLRLNDFHQVNDFRQQNDYRRMNECHLSNDLNHLNEVIHLSVRFLNVGNRLQSLQLKYFPHSSFVFESIEYCMQPFVGAVAAG